MSKFSLQKQAGELPILKDYAADKILLRDRRFARRDNDELVQLYEQELVPKTDRDQVVSSFAAALIVKQDDLADVDFSGEVAIWKQLVTTSLYAVRNSGSLDGNQTGVIVSATADEANAILDDPDAVRSIKRYSGVKSKQEIIDALKRFYRWVGQKVRDVQNPFS